jgi:4-hydroxy-2-oxoheptanedioate aldolase
MAEICIRRKGKGKFTMENRIKRILQENGYVIGTFISINAPSIVEVAGLSGLDFVIIDNEHSAIDIESVENLIRAAEVTGITPIVRIQENSQKIISRFLDIGAHGIQIPMISTVEEASLASRSCRFAPKGIRGVGLGRSARWGTVPDYFNTANEETLCVCMCETKKCVDDIDQIVRVDGIDVMFIGLVDLSQSLGFTGKIHHKEVEESVQKVLRALLRTEIVPGIAVQNTEEAMKRIEEGFRYIAVKNDMRLFQEKLQSITKVLKKDNSLEKSGLSLT